jgi:ribosomal protein S18 acetylase RimI-like enzyme
VSEVWYSEPEPRKETLGIVKPLYVDVYSEPPYNEGPQDIADFVDRWNYQSGQPGFRVILAHHENDLVGFAYGITLSRGTSWWNGLLNDVAEEMLIEDGRRTYAVIELAVDASHRRRGIGAELHRRLLAGRPEERVTLLTRPEAHPALAAYTAWGYVRIGRLRPGNGAPVYVAMLRPL